MKGTATDIMATLIDVLNQACQVEAKATSPKEGFRFYCNDFAISAYEDAFAVLEIERYAKKIVRGEHKGLWRLEWTPKFLKGDPK